MLSYLRCEEAEPNLANTCLGRPSVGKLLQVVQSHKKLPGDGAVNDDLVTIDVPEDASVRRRCAARIVFGLKAVNGNHQMQIAEFRPFGRDRANGAGHHLNLYTHHVELPDETGQLPVTNQRLAPDQGDMQGTEPPDQSEGSLYQFLAPPFPQSPQGAPVVQVSRFVRIAARTSERTLFRDFNGQERPVSPQDPPPGRENRCLAHERSFPSLTAVRRRSRACANN
jgi:hypothetical protein